MFYETDSRQCSLNVTKNNIFQRSPKTDAIRGLETSFKRQRRMNEFAGLFASLSARRTPAGGFSTKGNLPNCHTCDHQITLRSHVGDWFKGPRWFCLFSYFQKIAREEDNKQPPSTTHNKTLSNIFRTRSVFDLNFLTQSIRELLLVPSHTSLFPLLM